MQPNLGAQFEQTRPEQEAQPARQTQATAAAGRASAWRRTEATLPHLKLHAAEATMKPGIGVEPRFAESSGDGDDYWDHIERHRPDTAATSTLGSIIQIRASQMIGSSVYSLQNVDISKVRDLILPWRPVWARVPTPIPHRVSNTVPRSGGVVSQPGGFSCWRLHRREPSSEDFRM